MARLAVRMAVRAGRGRRRGPGRRGRSGGKGSTRIQAQVSAMCEAIERYSGVYRGEAFEVRASYRDLDVRAYRPNELMLMSDHQFDHRDAWNAGHRSSYHKVPVPFDDGAEPGGDVLFRLPAVHLERAAHLSAQRVELHHGSIGGVRGPQPLFTGDQSHEPPVLIRGPDRHLAGGWADADQGRMQGTGDRGSLDHPDQGMSGRARIYAGKRLFGKLVLQSMLDLVSLDYSF